MATKTDTKTNRDSKDASKAATIKTTKKNATVAKQAAKESKPAYKKISQIEAAIAVLPKAKQPMNCKAMVEAMQVEGLWASPGGATRNNPDNAGPRSTLRSFARSTPRPKTPGSKKWIAACSPCQSKIAAI